MSHSPAVGRLRIAMIGTRGVPASYGGFETAVEEIGHRLAARGHGVLVYRRGPESEPSPDWYRGMRTISLPALPYKTTETLSHTAASVLHAVVRAKPDVAFVFNAANAPLLPLLQAASIPVATHVDGLEWRRAKWGPNGRRYYQWAERRAVAWSDALIADAAGIASYYRDAYNAPTELLTYGAPILQEAGSQLLPAGLQPRAYHLCVARFEPENHVLEIVKGYAGSAASHPLVVVGAAPYAEAYTKAIAAVAEDDPRVRLIGRVYDQAVLDQLYGNALTYLHGHSVGGTNPSLLRAMGAGADVLAFDVNFNREVAGTHARYWTVPTELASLIGQAEADPSAAVEAGKRLQQRAAERYCWEEVTDGYESLALRLVNE